MSERKASMGDKVYRGDVVKFIRDNISLDTFMKRTVKTADEACWDLCDKLNFVPAIEEKPEPHWIPVEQDLPEEETDVLVTVHFLGLKRTHRNGWNEHIKESYYVEVASHINGEWSSASDEYKIARDRHKVIAWCELPEPFKGVTDG